jgi:hypothetical protein
MITKTFAMETKRLIIGLLAISALGIVSLPARADDAVIQDSVQDSYNEGYGNTSIQNSAQRSQINRRSRDEYGNYDDSDTGVVQNNDQICTQYGEDNLCVQNTDQDSRIHERGSHY